MGIDLAEYFNRYNQHANTKAPLHSFVGGNFQFVRLSVDNHWVLVQHIPTRKTRWLYGPRLRADKLDVVFYDADPAFIPSCDKSP